jgi:hypothetical protein
MADNLPINFPLPSEGSIASYNYKDLASGLGYVSFYGATFLDSTETVVYSLIDNVIQSYQEKTTPGINTNTTYDLDATFNYPCVLNGKCYIVIPMLNNNSGGNAFVVTINASLYKYDGSETQIGGTITKALTVNSNPSATIWDYLVGYFETGGKINFKRGDRVRLKINVVNGGNLYSGDNGGFASDPANLNNHSGSGNSGWLHSILKLDLPFVINN